MYVSPDDLKYCLSKADLIAGHYAKKYSTDLGVERSVDAVRAICAQVLDLNISACKLDIYKEESVVFASCFMYSDGRYEIAYVGDLNHCWTRYVVCKEIFHVLIDQQKFRNMEIEKHLDAVTIAFPDDESKAAPPAVSEFLAEVAAMEFLFPYRHRVGELRVPGYNPRDLAQKYRIPQVLVDKYLGAPFMANLEAHSTL